MASQQRSYIERIPEPALESLVESGLDPIDVFSLMEASPLLKRRLSSTYVILAKMFSNFFDEGPPASSILLMDSKQRRDAHVNIIREGRTIVEHLGRVTEMRVPSDPDEAEKFEKGIKRLVNRSFGDGSQTSKNMKLLQRFVRNLNNKASDWSMRWNQPAHTDKNITMPVILCCLHLFLDRKREPSVALLSEEDYLHCQHAAYTTCDSLFFLPRIPNIPKLLRILQLLRHHLLTTCNTISELGHAFRELDPSSRPSGWTKKMPALGSIPIIRVTNWYGTALSMDNDSRTALVNYYRDPTKAELRFKYHKVVCELTGDDTFGDNFERFLLFTAEILSWSEEQNAIAPLDGDHDYGNWLDSGCELIQMSETIRPVQGMMWSQGHIYLLKGYISHLDVAEVNSNRLLLQAMLFNSNEKIRPETRDQLVESVNNWTEPGDYVYDGMLVPGEKIYIGQWSDISEHLQTMPNDQRPCGPFLFWQVDIDGWREEVMAQFDSPTLGKPV